MIDMMTQEDIGKIIRKIVENGTPLANNICKNPDCGGQVIKRIASWCNGRVSYSLPMCEKCERIYSYAKNVRIIGVKEFGDMLNGRIG
jgi:hypothetical protein